MKRPAKRIAQQPQAEEWQHPTSGHPVAGPDEGPAQTMSQRPSAVDPAAGARRVSKELSPVDLFAALEAELAEIERRYISGGDTDPVVVSRRSTAGHGRYSSVGGTGGTTPPARSSAAGATQPMSPAPGTALPLAPHPTPAQPQRPPGLPGSSGMGLHALPPLPTALHGAIRRSVAANAGSSWSDGSASTSSSAVGGLAASLADQLTLAAPTHIGGEAGGPAAAQAQTWHVSLLNRGNGVLAVGGAGDAGGSGPGLARVAAQVVPPSAGAQGGGGSGEGATVLLVQASLRSPEPSAGGAGAQAQAGREAITVHGGRAGAAGNEAAGAGAAGGGHGSNAGAQAGALSRGASEAGVTGPHPEAVPQTWQAAVQMRLVLSPPGASGAAGGPGTTGGFPGWASAPHQSSLGSLAAPPRIDAPGSTQPTRTSEAGPAGRGAPASLHARPGPPTVPSGTALPQPQHVGAVRSLLQTFDFHAEPPLGYAQLHGGQGQGPLGEQAFLTGGAGGYAMRSSGSGAAPARHVSFSGVPPSSSSGGGASTSTGGATSSGGGGASSAGGATATTASPSAGSSMGGQSGAGGSRAGAYSAGGDSLGGLRGPLFDSGRLSALGSVAGVSSGGLSSRGGDSAGFDSRRGGSSGVEAGYGEGHSGGAGAYGRGGYGEGHDGAEDYNLGRHSSGPGSASVGGSRPHSDAGEPARDDSTGEHSADAYRAGGHGGDRPDSDRGYASGPHSEGAVSLAQGLVDSWGTDRRDLPHSDARAATSQAPNPHTTQPHLHAQQPPSGTPVQPAATGSAPAAPDAAPALPGAAQAPSPSSAGPSSSPGLDLDQARRKLEQQQRERDWWDQLLTQRRQLQQLHDKLRNSPRPRFFDPIHPDDGELEDGYGADGRLLGGARTGGGQAGAGSTARGGEEEDELLPQPEGGPLQWWQPQPEEAGLLERWAGTAPRQQPGGGQASPPTEERAGQSRASAQDPERSGPQQHGQQGAGRDAHGRQAAARGTASEGHVGRYGPSSASPGAPLSRWSYRPLWAGDDADSDTEEERQQGQGTTSSKPVGPAGLVRPTRRRGRGEPGSEGEAEALALLATQAEAVAVALLAAIEAAEAEGGGGGAGVVLPGRGSGGGAADPGMTDAEIDMLEARLGHLDLDLGSAWRWLDFSQAGSSVGVSGGGAGRWDALSAAGSTAELLRAARLAALQALQARMDELQAGYEARRKRRRWGRGGSVAGSPDGAGEGATPPRGPSSTESREAEGPPDGNGSAASDAGARASTSLRMILAQLGSPHHSPASAKPAAPIVTPGRRYGSPGTGGERRPAASPALSQPSGVMASPRSPPPSRRVQSPGGLATPPSASRGPPRMFQVTRSPVPGAAAGFHRPSPSASPSLAPMPPLPLPVSRPAASGSTSTAQPSAASAAPGPSPALGAASPGPNIRPPYDAMRAGLASASPPAPSSAAAGAGSLAAQARGVRVGRLDSVSWRLASSGPQPGGWLQLRTELATQHAQAAAAVMAAGQGVSGPVQHRTYSVSPRRVRPAAPHSTSLPPPATALPPPSSALTAAATAVAAAMAASASARSSDGPRPAFTAPSASTPDEIATLKRLAAAARSLPTMAPMERLQLWAALEEALAAKLARTGSSAGSPRDGASPGGSAEGGQRSPRSAGPPRRARSGSLSAPLRGYAAVWEHRQLRSAAVARDVPWRADAAAEDSPAAEEELAAGAVGHHPPSSPPAEDEGRRGEPSRSASQSRGVTAAMTQLKPVRNLAAASAPLPGLTIPGLGPAATAAAGAGRGSPRQGGLLGSALEAVHGAIAPNATLARAMSLNWLAIQDSVTRKEAA
ncbi:hypothetical protein HYH03_017787 [Edaphochlamys debaryana]|uniref:Uncharacterized protein n=1 Tax=Edaphochlamys debaryana TaxID=47281 RepID=A0A836BQ30_9CHLO|nr:hypothetical protein HYH03_017787 [Edaphochlamys debaryana]|eukprot:KAG2483339.1 hypothetical protein HYH03_017787 [Edaphochlamys debaryana]